MATMASALFCDRKGILRFSWRLARKRLESGAEVEEEDVWFDLEKMARRKYDGKKVANTDK